MRLPKAAHVLVLKSLHVAAAAIWIGNFCITGVWALRAYASRQPQLRAFAAREILFTDVVFTVLFGSAVVMTGFALAGIEHIDPGAVTWTRDALMIVIGAGVVWLAVLVPLEIKMYRCEKSGVAAGRAFVVWNIIGWCVTLALVFVIYLMIAKPV